MKFTRQILFKVIKLVLGKKIVPGPPCSTQVNRANDSAESCCSYKTWINKSIRCMELRTASANSEVSGSCIWHTSGGCGGATQARRNTRGAEAPSRIFWSRLRQPCHATGQTGGATRPYPGLRSPDPLRVLTSPGALRTASSLYTPSRSLIMRTPHVPSSSLVRNHACSHTRSHTRSRRRIATHLNRARVSVSHRPAPVRPFSRPGRRPRHPCRPRRAAAASAAGWVPAGSRDTDGRSCVRVQPAGPGTRAHSDGRSQACEAYRRLGAQEIKARPPRSGARWPCPPSE